MAAPKQPDSLSFEQLSGLREKTEQLSAFLTQRLRGHLTTLYPVLNPRRVFGRYLGARESVPRVEEVYAQLVEKYKQVVGGPFDLRSELDEQAMTAMEQGIEVYPWEYTHQTADKEITITSPVRWVLTYRSDYSLNQMRSLLTGRADRRPLSMQQFVVNALAMQIVLARNPGVGSLLEDLRYEVHVESGPNLGKLGLVTISALLPSFRPADDLILAATRLSGVSTFVELIGPDAVHNLADPLRTKMDAILNGAGGN